jgi:tripartite ATP-independent periplasmic transporter dctQ component
MHIKPILKNIDYFISGVSLLILVILTFIGVFRRYFFNAPIPYLQEMQLFCAVWMVFWGGSVAVRKSGIVSIDFIVSFFSKKTQFIWTIIVTLLCIAVLLFLAINGFKQLVFMAQTTRGTYVLGIPYSIIYSAFPAGCCLMALWYAIDLITIIRNRDSSEIETEENA